MGILESVWFSGAIQPADARALADGLRWSLRCSGNLARSRGWWAQWWAHLATDGEKGRAHAPAVASGLPKMSVEPNQTHIGRSRGRAVAEKRVDRFLEAIGAPSAVCK
jgi:hypothetical protein